MLYVGASDEFSVLVGLGCQYMFLSDSIKTTGISCPFLSHHSYYVLHILLVSILYSWSRPECIRPHNDSHAIFQDSTLCLLG